jgi:hypothetical protein
MFFFDDNNFVLRQGDPLGERLSKVAQEQNILACDQCAVERNLAEGASGGPRSATPKNTVPGVRVGCFPDMYQALSGNPPDYVITI